MDLNILWWELTRYNVVSRKFRSFCRVISGWSAESKLERTWCNVSDVDCFKTFLFRLPQRGFTDPSKNISSCEMLRPESDTENLDSGPDDSTERGFGLRTASPLWGEDGLENTVIWSLSFNRCVDSMWFSPTPFWDGELNCAIFRRCGLYGERTSSDSCPSTKSVERALPSRSAGEEIWVWNCRVRGRGKFQ